MEKFGVDDLDELTGWHERRALCRWSGLLLCGEASAKVSL